PGREQCSNVADTKRQCQFIAPASHAPVSCPLPERRRGWRLAGRTACPGSRMPTLAKLTRPKVHRALHPDRLVEPLDRSRGCPLVWVVSPPGAGKTTLVASYVEARKLSAIWYQIDAGDDDIGSFFYYLAQAVPAARARRAAPLPLLTPEYR